MLTKLALKNIRYYAKNYMVYLMTVCFSAWAYYMFLAFANGENMQQMQLESKVYRSCFGIGSWVLLIFTAIFIWYSTDFFFQNRKQEFGLYLLMGIKKQMVGKLLVTETVVMGMFSVAAGVIIGIASLGPVQSLIRPLFAGNAKMAEYLSVTETGMMLLKFFLVFVVFSILNYQNVKKSELTKLFHAGDEHEAPMRTSNILGVISILILVTGYVVIFQVKGGAQIHLLPIGLGMVMAGTVFTFMQLTGSITQKIRCSEKCARNVSTRMNVTGMLHRIRRNTGSWAAISLLIAVSMSVNVVAFTMYQSVEKMTKEFGSEIGEYLDVSKMLIFILVLTCISVLASTGSMLYFKVMSDLSDNRKNYRLLYCIGTGKKELGKMVSRQSMTMFTVPLAVGIIHTSFFAYYVHKRNLLSDIMPVLISVVIFISVYLLYYTVAVVQGHGQLKQLYKMEETRV